jgi:PST family polysaccharide transporter
MGLGFSAAAAIAALTAWLSRLYLISEFGIEAVGIYQASWTISNIYIGTILTAMGVDFMPRLMKVIRDNDATNKMATEQIEFGVLLSSIGILGILVFSPLVLNIFYSAEFAAGTSIIRWQVLGVAMRVFGFVFGFIIMAKEKPGIYVLVQTAVHLADWLLLILFSKLFGFDGLGVNYFVSYSIYLALTYTVCGRLIGFRFSRNIGIITAVEIAAVAAVWFLPVFFEGSLVLISGCGLMVVYMMWVIHAAKKYMNLDVVKIVEAKLKRRK